MIPDPLQQARDEGRVRAPSRALPRLTFALTIGCALLGLILTR